MGVALHDVCPASYIRRAALRTGSSTTEGLDDVMIVTLTANPAVDQTMLVHEVVLGSINRATDIHLDPAGKGINVSRVVHRLEWPTVALGFLGGETGHIVRSALDAEGVDHRFVSVPGRTRVNITVREEDGRATGVYGPGPAVTPRHLDEVDNLLDEWKMADVVVLAGSLPPGAPDDWYARLIRRAHASDVTTVRDTHGTALRRGIDAAPRIIKPNVSEAEELLGRTLGDVTQVVGAARELAERCGGTAIVSMGAEGAVCAQDSDAWLVVPPRIETRSTVGSGDSFIAGLSVALARGDALLEGFRLGAACGAATAASGGTSLASAQAVAELLPSVRIEPFRGDT
jgi:1-phosphofructokinase family hexose kinase